MAYNDFFVSGDQADARALFESIVAAEGYAITDLPNGARKYERGNKTKTVWLGVWAGKDFWCWFTASYFTAADGQFVGRITSNTGQGMLGGVYGVAKASGMYDELVAKVHAGLVGRQRLTNLISA